MNNVEEAFRQLSCWRYLNACPRMRVIDRLTSIEQRTLATPEAYGASECVGRVINIYNKLLFLLIKFQRKSLFRELSILVGSHIICCHSLDVYIRLIT